MQMDDTIRELATPRFKIRKFLKIFKIHKNALHCVGVFSLKINVSRTGSDGSVNEVQLNGSCAEI